MKDILTIAKKEILDTVRDKRTLAIMVLIPLLLFPSILWVTATVGASTAKKESQRKLKVGYFTSGEDKGLRHLLESPLNNFDLIALDDTAGARALIPDSLQAVIALPADFSAQLGDTLTGEVVMLYDQTEDITRNRVKGALQAFQTQLEQERWASLGLSAANVKPLKIVQENVATAKETIGKLAGGFLPYIIIIFAFLGCMYTAIDLFAGEKERGSFETILTVPVERWKILVGKMSVIVLVGMTTTLLGFLGLFLGLQVVDTLPDRILEVVNGLLSPGFILTMMGLLLLLTTLFAGIMTPLSLNARSYKEAQGTITPLNFVVIIPAIIGLMPGIELNVGTALIPVLNITLCTKELIAGTLDPLLLLLAAGSLLALAVLSVVISFRRFGHESNVLRS